MIKYSIGIVTYNLRFERFLKPLVDSIKTINPDIEIIICINGNHGMSFDEIYRKNILLYLTKYNNIFPMMFTQHRSLSKLWNNLLINSTTDLMLRIDDDVSIDKDFFIQLNKAIIQNECKSFKINGSWSHTLLNRNEINAVGWFDEKLLGGGEEDGDFEWRYANFFHREFINVSGLPILNHWNQYDYDTCLLNQKKCNGKRSLFNKNYINKKYILCDNGESHGILFDGQKIICVEETINQYPSEYFFWENSHEL